MKGLLAVTAAGLLLWSGSTPAADFNGDGTNDIGIFRPSTGLWAIRGVTRAYFGTSGDTPMPGDYNGDGTVDIAIFRPSTGLWAVREGDRVYFGKSGDQPLPGVTGAAERLWTSFGDDIYRLTGSVGIGASPNYRLTVRGPSNNIFPVRITNNNLLSSLYLGFGLPTGHTYANITSSGNNLVLQQYSDQRVGIGHTNPGYTLDVNGPIWLRDRPTNPGSSPNSSGLYSDHGALIALDAAGNATQLTTHDRETGEWIFYSKNITTGRVVRVDMERMVRAIEELTGENFMVERWEAEGEF